VRRLRNARNTTVVREHRTRHNKLHPTMKPVALIVHMIRNSSRPGDAVLDLCGGSGSTLVACEKTRRHARLVELDPRYCDVILQRYQELTGQPAILAGTGQHYAELARAVELRPRAVELRPRAVEQGGGAAPERPGAGERIGGEQ